MSGALMGALALSQLLNKDGGGMSPDLLSGGGLPGIPGGGGGLPGMGGGGMPPMTPSIPTNKEELLRGLVTGFNTVDPMSQQMALGLMGMDEQPQSDAPAEDLPPLPEITPDMSEEEVVAIMREKKAREGGSTTPKHLDLLRSLLMNSSGSSNFFNA